MSPRALTLSPSRFAEPRCDSFEDELTVREYERASRVYRAYTESYRIVARDGRIDGAYAVTGANQNTYVVDVVDGSATRDACACPDFLANGLGTCKHLEAVRRAIATRPSLRRAYRALAHKPAVPTLTIEVDRGVALCTLGPWSTRALASVGLARGSDGRLDVKDPAKLSAGFHGDSRRIVAAAVSLAHRLHTEHVLTARRRDLSRAIASRAIGVDVLRHPLFPYQRDGVAHLVTAGRALLADDMGLGKTVQAIAACEVLRARGEASRVLVVTAASLKDQWAREIEKYTGQRAVVVAGGAAARREAIASDAPYKILNYELTWRELSLLQSLEADVLVLDEAQRARNFRTKTARTLRAIPSRFLFVLTGTPVENRLDDLYSLLQLIDPGVLGPLWKYNLAFHVQSPSGKVQGYKNLAALRERIAPVVLRRRKDDVLLQLPPLTEQTRYVPLHPRQLELEHGFRADAAVLLHIAERRALSPDEQKRLQMLLLKARQACNAVELCDPESEEKASPKLDEFVTLVGEITAQGTSKVLVFSEWVKMLRLASARLDAMGIGHALLHGGIPSEKRPALLERFREDADLRVLLSSDAGGVGLNLQVASYVIHLDLPWNPARLDQRTARAHRLGQTRGVSVTYLCAESGIERGIEGTLAGKRAVRSAALDAGSDVDTLAVQSFTGLMRQLRETLEAVQSPAERARDVADGGSEPGEVEEQTPRDERASEAAPIAAIDAPVLTEPAAEAMEHASERVDTREGDGAAGATRDRALDADRAAGSVVGAGARVPGVGATRAANRLRFARVVLAAGFAGDAVRAAYEALAASIAGQVEGAPPTGHTALVAAIYRDLIPRGKLPPAAHVTLARLHDLASLEAHDVVVDATLAEETVREAEEWVARLGA